MEPCLKKVTSAPGSGSVTGRESARRTGLHWAGDRVTLTASGLGTAPSNTYGHIVVEVAKSGLKGRCTHFPSIGTRRREGL